MKTIYRFTHFAHYLTTVSGLGYYIALEFMQQETAYGLRPHPHQNLWQGFHIIVVPFLVFAIGLLWRDHIWKKIKKGTPRKRRSGLVLLVSFFLMTLTGYLIQISGALSVIGLIKDSHLYTSFIWILFYGWHQFSEKLLKKPQV